MAEYTPPPVPAPPKPPTLSNSRLFKVWFALAIGVAIWTAFAVRYYYYLFPESPINPVRHPVSFRIFIAALVFTSAVTFVLPICSHVLHFFWSSTIFASFYVFVSFIAVIIFTNWRPYSCENMTSRFPIYVKMEAGNLATGKVYFNNRLLWGLEHTKVDHQVYHTSMPWKYRTWTPSIQAYSDNYKATDWPQETAVNEIWTSVKPAQGADGTINGTCQEIPCLKGRFWMYPNLKFEWTYTNPKTGKKTIKRMSSEEGKWFFGTKDLPLASLKSNGTDIFRAQSTNTVCSGGDGDIETSLVPLGLMFIAENIYYKIGS